MQNRILISFLLIFTLSACTRDPNVQFIQGTWENAQADGGNRFFQWVFDNGTFTRQQEIDSGTFLYTTGQYQLVESDGDLLTLELFDFSGDRISYEDSPMTIRIEIDRANDTARIANALFIRVTE
jgi:hypothetical protein